MSTTVLHETSYGVGASRQDYGLERVYALTWRGAVNVTRTEKVRVIVHVDSSHPQQSRFVAEVWTKNGWREVDRIIGDDPAMIPPKGPARRGETGIASGYVPVEHRQEKVDSLEWAAALLLERAKQVLR